MDLDETLVELEQRGWQSLVDGEGRAFYRSTMADDAVVLGGGVGVVTGEAALDRLSGTTWSWFRIRAPRATLLTDDVAVLTYRIVARRDFDVEYQAVAASTYRRDGDAWKLVLHQETPM